MKALGIQAQGEIFSEIESHESKHKGNAFEKRDFR